MLVNVPQRGNEDHEWDEDAEGALKIAISGENRPIGSGRTWLVDR